MPAETMTSRERILAAIHGREVDRFPVWLKMTNATWRSSQPEEVRRLGEVELLQAAGCDLMLGNRLGVRREAPRVRTTCTEENGRRTTVYETPDGTLTEVNSRDPCTDSWHPTRYPVGNAADLRALRWLFTDTTCRVDGEAAGRHAAAQEAVVAADAVTMSGIGPGPLMAMVEHWAGPENALYLLADEPGLYEETLQLMHEDRLRELRALLPHLRADTFWLTENTSTTLISPTLFRRYCMPHLADYGNTVLEHGVIPVHHMCGTLNALLEMIDSLPALVNEAYTTRPLGDVSLAEGRRRMPSKCLIGGTNATLWMSDADTIVRTVADDLAACPDTRRIFLTSAGVLTPLCPLEKARAVTDRLKELPVRSPR